MAKAHITSLNNAIDFLEVHESLMQEMIDDKKFPLPMRIFSKSLLESMDRYHSAVQGNNLNTASLEKLGELVVRVQELGKMISVAERELKAKLEVYEESGE